MTTNGSPMLSGYEPPSDPEAIPAWLLAQEEEIAALVVRRLTAIVEQALTAFTQTLTAAGDMGAFDSVPIEWTRFVTTELSDRLGGMYLSGGISAWIQAPGTDALPESTATGWTEVVNQQAITYAQNASNRLSGPVADSIWNDLKLKVAKTIETGASTEKLTAEIRMMSEFAGYRAEMIARTEVNGAYNAGTYQSNEALGDMGPAEKYWVATGDDRTRETHREANGQVRAFADPFDIGGSQMLYPHDPAGPAKEVINCRCVLGYLYPGMARPDGTIVPEPMSEIIETSTTQTLRTAGQDRDLLSDLQGSERSGLSERLPHEARMIAQLTEREVASLRTYTGSAFEDINYALRRNQALSSVQTEIVRDIDSAIAKAGTADEPFITYRGMTLPKPQTPPGQLFSQMTKDEQFALIADQVEGQYPVGSRVSWQGQFASSSTDVSAPLNHAVSRDTPGVIFEVQARRGAPISSLSKYDDEWEVILPRDAQYEVVGVEDALIYDFASDASIRRIIVQLREVL